MPLRGEDGYCKVCSYGEVGLAVSKIASTGGIGRFEGYTDSAASNKKILINVLEKDDRYFNSGDLLSRDSYGFFYWSDRVGDTFRWKGENVATTEVEAVVAAVNGIGDVAVYGVEIPGCDGRAGMASVKLQENTTIGQMDWSLFHIECAAHLPVYSRPLFIRVRNQMTVTSTFKHQKNDLIKEGFNPAMMNGDLLFYYTAKDGSVVPVDDKLYNDIMSGVIKF